MKKLDPIKFNKISSERHLDLNKLMKDTFSNKKKSKKSKTKRTKK